MYVKKEADHYVNLLILKSRVFNDKFFDQNMLHSAT